MHLDRHFTMQLLSVLTLLLLQGATVHGESSIPPPLQAVLTANSELLSALDYNDVYEGPHSNPDRSAFKVLYTFSDLSKFTASALSIAPLLNFFSSFHEEDELPLKAIGEMISKIDGALAEGPRLYSRMDYLWTDYVRECGSFDEKIKTSWAVLKDFLEKVPTAKTIEEKSRLARRFTDSYGQAQMDTSVANLYKCITSARLTLDTYDKNFYRLGHYFHYLSSVMVLGLQMKVYYYTLTDIRGAAAKAEETMTQMSDFFLAVQNVLINCLESFMLGVSDYIPKQHGLPHSMLKERLDYRYNWCNWTVTTVQGNDKPPTDFMGRVELGPTHWVYLQCAHRHILQPCTEELCPSQRGRCRNLKALGGGFCQCAKMFYGPKCDRSVRDDIDQSLLGQGDNPIIVPDLTTIFYSIMDLKALLKNSN